MSPQILKFCWWTLEIEGSFRKSISLYNTSTTLAALVLPPFCCNIDVLHKEKYLASFTIWGGYDFFFPQLFYWFIQIKIDDSFPALVIPTLSTHNPIQDGPFRGHPRTGMGC